MKRNFKITSGIIALLIGLSIGFYFSSITQAVINIIFDSSLKFSTTKYVFSILFGGLFLFWDYKHPKAVETLGFVFSSFIILQSLFWDFPAGDINKFRVITFTFSLGLLILNSFTGYLRWNSGIKFFKRALGFK